MECTIIHNENDCRFETVVDGQFAYVEYAPFEGGLDFIHTWVPKEIGGRGVAAALVAFALQYALAHQLKVIPSCPYVKVYLMRHDEYKTLCW